MHYILVTGGAGYIGSHTVRLLAQSGYQPIVLDDLSKGHREAVTGFPLELGHAGDKALLRRIFTRYPIEAVMHFAAYTEVSESVLQPDKYYQNNTEQTKFLLESMAENKIPYFVFSSTAAIFGESHFPTINENHPQKPLNPYGRSKWLTEKILSQFESTYGLKYTVLRYFNAAGADDSGEIGESHSPETHLIPLILQAACGKRPHIHVFGNDYATDDGTCIRDFIHVNDLARAHILALEKMKQDQTSRYFNLGSGNGHSVAQVIKEVKQITGVDFPVIISPRRPGDPARLVADNTQITHLLGWQPRYNLSRIIQTAWQWEQHRRF